VNFTVTDNLLNETRRGSEGGRIDVRWNSQVKICGKRGSHHREARTSIYDEFNFSPKPSLILKFQNNSLPHRDAHRTRSALFRVCELPLEWFNKTGHGRRITMVQEIRLQHPSICQGEQHALVLRYRLRQLPISKLHHYSLSERRQRHSRHNNIVRCGLE